MPSLSLIRLRKLKRIPFSLTLGLVGQDDAWTFGTARMTTLTVTRPYNNMLELINRAAIGEHGKLGGCKGDSGGPVFAIRSGAPLVVGIMTAVRYCGGATFVTPLRLTAKALAAWEWALAGSRSVLWRKLARYGR
jgi:Trypsin